MKKENFELQTNVTSLTFEEMQFLNGGIVFGWQGFTWDMFWSGCKVGLATGGGAAAAYYCMA